MQNNVKLNFIKQNVAIPNAIMLSVAFCHCYAECSSAECCYAEFYNAECC